METRIEQNCNVGNYPIPNKKEAKATVYVVMRSCEHSDELVTSFFSLEDAKCYCEGVDDYYIIDSNVF